MLKIFTSLYKNGTLNQNLIIFLEKCKSMSELKRIHALVITFGITNNDFLSSKLINFSALSDSGDIDYSYRILAYSCYSSTFHWNTVIRGYSKSRNPSKSISVFVKMLRYGVSPDYLTYPFLAKASARLGEIRNGSAVHAWILKTGYELDRFVKNSLIHMYASCRDIVYARKLFDEMSDKNSVSWNSMLDGYAKCGNLEMARALFDEMPDRDVVSWSSLIDGYVKNGDHRDALAVFEKMRVNGPTVNEVTMVSVMCACVHLGALDLGKKMHQYLIDSELPLTLTLRTSLVDMYAKCGAIQEAFVVFRGVMKSRSDVLIWNAMIGGLATHGLVQESLDLFKEMRKTGINPDEITYLCLLSACAHGGLVKDAWFFFECLGRSGMTPKSEHYACMVDVLARAGKLEEAYEFLCQMPMEPNASILGALLNGCMSHGRPDVAEIIGTKLIEMEPEHDGRYIGLSNAYASAKRWGDAKRTREVMERRGVKKSPGYSSVELSGAIHRFVAHDRSHPCLEQIYEMTRLVIQDMRFVTKSEEHFLFDMEFV